MFRYPFTVIPEILISPLEGFGYNTTEFEFNTGTLLQMSKMTMMLSFAALPELFVTVPPVPGSVPTLLKMPTAWLFPAKSRVPPVFTWKIWLVGPDPWLPAWIRR